MAIDILADRMVLKMYHLVEKAHKGQLYGQYPYAMHCQEVARLLNIDPIDRYYPTYKIVALGHDLLEDTEVTEDDLLDDGFSSIVVEAIKALTKRSDESRLEYLDRVMENNIAHTVKIADSLHNLISSVYSMDTRRIEKYSDNLLRLCK